MTATGIRELKERGDKALALIYQEKRDAALGRSQTTSTQPSEAELYVRDTIIAELADFLDEEEIENHSSNGGDWTTLRSMQDPTTAGNNCHAATWYVVETVVEQIGTEPDENVDAADMVFSDGSCHYGAQFTTSDGERVIIDYTARQFSEDFPFPYIAQRQVWEQEIAAAAKRKFDLDYDADNQPAYT